MSPTSPRTPAIRPSPSKPPPSPSEADGDELDELPPLDGATEDSADLDQEEIDGDLAGEEDGSGENSLDDSTGEDESPDTRDLSLDVREKTWLGEATETPDLDLGDMSLFAVHDETENGLALDEPEADARAIDDEDAGLADSPQRIGLDSGDEGPIDEDEELRDEDLPALDADDEGESEDAAFEDPRFATNDPLGLPWAASPWVRVGAPLGVIGATAIVCAGHGAIVAGRIDAGGDPRDEEREANGGVSESAPAGENAEDGDEEQSQLSLVDLEGAQRKLVAAGLEGTRVVSLAAACGLAGPELVAVVVRGGRVAVSTDGGGTFEFAESLRGAAEVAVVSGVIWVRSRDGSLRRFDEDRPLALGAAGGAAAIVANGPRLAGLVLQEDRRPTALLVVTSAVTNATSAEGLAREPIAPRDGGDVPESRAPALFAARGSHAAYAGRTGVVRRGLDGTWKSFPWPGRVTALTFVDDGGTLLAAVYLDADDSTALVRLDSNGNATIIGRLDAPRNRIRCDGRVLGMAYDDARGVVWIAGGFGVAAFAIAS